MLCSCCCGGCEQKQTAAKWFGKPQFRQSFPHAGHLVARSCLAFPQPLQCSFVASGGLNCFCCIWQRFWEWNLNAESRAFLSCPKKVWTDLLMQSQMLWHSWLCHPAILIGWLWQVPQLTVWHCTDLWWVGLWCWLITGHVHNLDTKTHNHKQQP